MPGARSLVGAIWHFVKGGAAPELLRAAPQSPVWLEGFVAFCDPVATKPNTF